MAESIQCGTACKCKWHHKAQNNEKLNLKVKGEKILIGESKEVKEISPNSNATFGKK